MRVVFDGRHVFGALADRLPDAIAVDRADDSWVAVAAASVVAKRRRDALYALIARRIRSEPWGKEIALIALTGWGQEEDRRRSQEAGFDGHLVKPVNYPGLMTLLASLGVAK